MKHSAAKPAADARKRSAGAVAVRARKKFVHAPVSPHNSGAYLTRRMSFVFAGSAGSQR